MVFQFGLFLKTSFGFWAIINRRLGMLNVLDFYAKDD